ncbi:MAG: hypothetical protein NDJ92_02575 [Thermoanaerobaculia bacterium]|nr:hypothetical protein [Thermoanaerobaculia bacterium]
MSAAARVLVLGLFVIVSPVVSTGDELAPRAVPLRPPVSTVFALPEANGPNQVVNGSFKTDFSSWNPILSIPSFSSTDASNSPSSGSVVVLNSLSGANLPVDLRQCFAITGLTPGRQYAWGGKVRIPSGQTRSGYAYMYLVWVSNLTSYDYCSGHVQVDAGAVVHSSGVPANQWIPLTGPVVTAPSGAVGAQISFNNQKDQAGESFRYHADDAFLYEINVATTTSIIGPSSGDAGAPLVFEASATGCTPDPTGWNWTATGGATVTAATTRTASIVFPSSGTFSVATSNSACGSNASKQVGITSRGPELAVTAPTRGLVQDPNVGGATDSYALTNVGGGPTTVTLTQFGSFFTQSPASFPLSPGQTQIVTLTGLPQPAGLYGGTSLIAGTGVAQQPTGVTLLVAAAPSGSVLAAPQQNRVDVVDATSGSATFVNSGTGTLNGTVVSKVPWLRTDGSVVVIPPGSNRSVPFTIDRARRPDGNSPLGSVAGGMELVFRASGSGARSAPEAGPPSGASLVTVVDTVKPPTSSTTIPALLPGQLALFVPGVGHITGTVGVFLSDISITSTLPSGSIGDLVMYYTPKGGSASQQTTVSAVPSGKPVGLADLVKGVFGADAQIGTLQLRSSQIDRISIGATVINSSNAAGTYGTVIPVFRSDRGIAPVADAPGTLVLTGLRKDGSGHTNLYLQETVGLPTKVQIQFRDANGLALETRIEDLAPFALVSRNDTVPAGAVMATLSHFTQSNGRFVAFATPVDRASGDTWAVSDWRHQYAYSGTQPMLVPIVGTLHGVNNTYFRTDVSLTNVSPATGTATARYYPRGGSMIERSITLGSNQSRVVSDVVANLFNVSGDSVGHVIVTPTSGNFVVTSRTYTTVQGQAATLGTGVPTLALNASLKAGDTRRIGGIEDAAFPTIATARPGTFRTNFGLVETSGKSATVRVTLRYTYSASGATVVASTATATKDYQLTPNQFMLLTNIAKELIGPDRDTRFGDLRNMQADFAVTSGDGSVAVFISSTDNGTGDTILRVD